MNGEGSLPPVSPTVADMILMIQKVSVIPGTLLSNSWADGPEHVVPFR